MICFILFQAFFALFINIVSISLRHSCFYYILNLILHCQPFHNGAGGAAMIMMMILVMMTIMKRKTLLNHEFSTRTLDLPPGYHITTSMNSAQVQAPIQWKIFFVLQHHWW